MKINKRFDQYQQNYREFYNLSESEEQSILAQLPHPKFLEFTFNRVSYLPANNNFFIDSYNAIKAESWPECNTLDDLKKLPPHMIEECKTVHNFDFLIWERDKITPDDWKNYGGGAYPITEIIKYKNTVLDLLKYIKNKKILDIACHCGFTGLVCLHNGAESVIATNVRKKFVDIANECMSLSEYGNNYNCVQADIHDYSNNTKLAKDSETVLLYGIMYHVHDHFEIIKSIADGAPKHIIIDSDIDPKLIDNPTPIISWTTEDADNPWNGVSDKFNPKHTLVGIPTESWFTLVLGLVGYKLVELRRFRGGHIESFDVSLLSHRSVMVFEKIN